MVQINRSISAKKKAKPLIFHNKTICTPKNEARIERLYGKVTIIGPNGSKFPENTDQLKKFCSDMKKNLKEIEHYTKQCYTKEVQQYSSLAIYTIRSTIRRYCSKRMSKFMADLMSVAPCGNRYVQPNDVCVRNFIEKTAPLVYIDDDKKKIPHICCNYYTASNCLEEFLNSIKCLGPYAGNVMDIFRTSTQQVVDFSCGEYTDQTDGCKRLGPMPKPRQPNKKRYVSIPTVLVDVLDSIEDYIVPGEFN